MRPWDMELPKFINDSRYRGVKTLRERRDLFDEHCKHLVRERRAKKAAAGERKADVSRGFMFLHAFVANWHYVVACKYISGALGSRSHIYKNTLGGFPAEI